MSTTETTVPKISKTSFTTDVNNGMKKEELSAKYGVDTKTVLKIAKQLGIKVKRTVKPKYQLIEETSETQE